MRRWILGVLAVGGVLIASPAHAGKLGDVRSETSSSSDSEDSSGSESSGGSGGSGGGPGAAIGGAIAAAMAEAIVEAYVESVFRLYTRYPYEVGTPGHVYIIPKDTEEERPGQRLSGSLTLDGAALGPTLGRAGLDLRLMMRRFGLGLDFSPQLELSPRDALMLGSAHLMVAPVLRPRGQVAVGVGVGAMIDGRVLPPMQRSDAVGFNATLQTTLLPLRPMVLRGRADVGKLGAATTWLARGTVGAIVRRWEVFGGYEGRGVGEVVLHGPTAGVRLWF